MRLVEILNLSREKKQKIEFVLFTRDKNWIFPKMFIKSLNYSLLFLQFLREELKYDSGYEKRHKSFHYNDDTQISVKELWEAWLRSEVIF